MPAPHLLSSSFKTLSLRTADLEARLSNDSMQLARCLTAAAVRFLFIVLSLGLDVSEAQKIALESSFEAQPDRIKSSYTRRHQRDSGLPLVHRGSGGGFWQIRMRVAHREYLLIPCIRTL